MGAYGEMLAAEFLRKKKYKILESGYRCRFGEIDIIAANKSVLAFVEVKLRKNSAFAGACEYVDVHKQSRLRTTAEMYLSQNPTNLQPRFDVIEIYAENGTSTIDPIFNHIEDAFE